MIIPLISSSTGLDADYINKLVSSANYRYKIYKIRKRTTGFRTISHPSAELKLLQRWVADHILSNLPVHDSVYSYRIGRGIRDIATLHKKNKYLLRIDFSDFFPSIKSRDISILLRKHATNISFSLSDRDIQIIQKITCKDGALTIGAPSSPAISNAILYNLDSKCFNLALSFKALYSRYADDIYFSTNKEQALSVLFDKFRDYLKMLKSPALLINDKKTVFCSKKNKRIVTGLILTSENRVSIGRSKKRFIKGMVCRFVNGQLNEKETSYLRGFLSYVKAVDPSFLISLKRKYGAPMINKVFKTQIISNK